MERDSHVITDKLAQTYLVTKGCQIAGHTNNRGDIAKELPSDLTTPRDMRRLDGNSKGIGQDHQTGSR
jgi:hypothetical protein